MFFTTSAEYAFDSYSVSALDYVMKPISSDSFRRVMDKYQEKFKGSELEEIVIQTQSSVANIALHNLCYVEVFDHYLVYHLANSDVIRCRQSLSKIEQILKKNQNFVKTHRSYIVNMDYISKIEKDGITMENGNKPLITRKNFKLILNAFLQNKFKSQVFARQKT